MDPPAQIHVLTQSPSNPISLTHPAFDLKQTKGSPDFSVLPPPSWELWGASEGCPLLTHTNPNNLSFSFSRDTSPPPPQFAPPPPLVRLCSWRAFCLAASRLETLPPQPALRGALGVQRGRHRTGRRALERFRALERRVAVVSEGIRRASPGL